MRSFALGPRPPQDVVSAEDDEAPAEFPAPTDKLSELLDRVRRREYKKRMLTSLSFGLTETMEIAVRLYVVSGGHRGPRPLTAGRP